MEQAALQEQAEREEAEKRRAGRELLLQQQVAQLDEQRKQKEQERVAMEEERRMEEERQKAEDEAIAEERRRILEQHAPLLIGFLPPGVFRDMDEIKTLPADVQAQFKRHIRIQDDPDLWWLEWVVNTMTSYVVKTILT